MEFKRKLLFYCKGIKRAIARMKRETKKLLIISFTMLLIGGFLGGEISAAKEQRKANKELTRITEEMEADKKKELDKLQKKLDAATGEKKKEIPWYLVLVNKDTPMEEGYEPELTELMPNYSVDSRIAEAAKQMLSDAKKAGMKINMCSAYRSVERQEQLFDESVQDRLSKGLDYWEAFVDTRQSVAEPGTSEHALGLALDLISNQYTELDQRQEQTKEAKWLAENCHKYGFILRYPPEKTDITGIIYEPWHYRYVGVEDATKIMELEITLEEYLEEYY